jgi:hypothetical protein
MGERIARLRIQREPNFLYYVKADEQGWLCVYKAELKRGGRKKNAKSIQSDKERAQTEQAL